MAVSPAPPRFPRQRRTWLLLLAAPPLATVGLSLWFTEPLDVRRATPEATPPAPEASIVPGGSDTAAAADEPPRLDPFPVWPEGRTTGEPAKRIVFGTLLAVCERLAKADGYTATFRKQERLSGALAPEQTMKMKVRHKPFAVYLKFVSPTPGREVVYAEGHHDNKVIAHATGVARLLVPRLAVPPDHPLAMAENRHPITEAGILNLAEKLLRYRRLDLDDEEAETILDQIAEPGGRRWLRSVHTHPKRHPDRPFARVEVLYDPETRLPLRIASFDWPVPGQEGELDLAERYAYDDLDVSVELSPLDFDPANPDYAFHR